MVGSIAAACGKSAATVNYHPRVDPVAFSNSTTIDNPFMPLVPGTRLVYRTTSKEGSEDEVVDVTHDTRLISGVRVVVVHDVVSKNGAPTEDTFDWYGQDRDGNVWYFGEDTKTLKNGKVDSTDGSWEAGVDGAQPGIVMEAHPKVGDAYRQEYLKGVAEDQAKVLTVDQSVQVQAGMWQHALMTQDGSRLDPAIEHKYFVRGIGDVLEVDVKHGTERVELVRIEHP